jgi:hypothetical protein
MPRYFTVDRQFRLSTDKEILCDHDFSQCKFFPVRDAFTKADLEKLAIELFPSGLSQHGKSHFLDQCLVIPTAQGPAPYVPNIPMIELVSELTRRTFFPEKPSRFTTLFAWASLEEAFAFKKQYGEGNIYEVEAETAFKADMNQLYLGGSGVGALFYAMKYWKGEAGSNPIWEYLLVPPVRVIGQVEIA